MVYVMSDIHGNLRAFRSVMSQINLRPEDTLYVLGDVMDRYPDGVAIMQELMDMPNAELLMGNHEYMMLCVMDPETIRGLDELERYQALPRWFRNGGEVTKRALEALDPASREKIISYVRDLPLFYEVDVAERSYRLIHTAPLELYFIYRHRYNSQREFAVWYRWPMEEAFPWKIGRIFVSGHTATYHYNDQADPMEIYCSGNRICIDCGAGYPPDMAPKGRLACLRLDDGKAFYSEEPEEEKQYRECGSQR